MNTEKEKTDFQKLINDPFFQEKFENCLEDGLDSLLKIFQAQGLNYEEKAYIFSINIVNLLACLGSLTSQKIIDEICMAAKQKYIQFLNTKTNKGAI